MANKKAKKKQPIIMKRPQRMKRAKKWVGEYKGENIVQDYRKEFTVDTPCAIEELKRLGYKFDPEYLHDVKSSETERLAQIEWEKERKRYRENRNQPQYDDFQDSTFAFIAGYTSGGAPYGTTWEEIGMRPYDEQFDDGVRDYFSLSDSERNSIDSRLREYFSQYVKTHRRMPNRNQRARMIEAAFDSLLSGPVVHTEEFNARYRKIVRSRENAFIREGLLSRRFSATEKQHLFEQSIMLESERLLFRKLTEDDYDDVARLMRDPEVISVWGHTFSDERIRKWVDNQLLRYRTDIVGSFAAVEKASGAFVGLMGLQWNDIDEVRGLEIGYMVSPRFWHKGFATEGAAALARYAFDLFGINRVYATIRPENTASQRVAERIGMKVEGGYTKHFNDMEMEHTIYVLERLIE